MKNTITMTDQVKFHGFSGLGKTISFVFLPSGIVIQNGLSKSVYAIPTKRDEVSPVVKEMLYNRGWEDDTPYQFVFLDDGYYEMEPHHRDY